MAAPVAVRYLVIAAAFGILLIAVASVLIRPTANPGAKLTGTPPPVDTIQLPPERFDTATVRRRSTFLQAVPILSALMAPMPPGHVLGRVTFDGRQFVATGVFIDG